MVADVVERRSTMPMPAMIASGSWWSWLPKVTLPKGSHADQPHGGVRGAQAFHEAAGRGPGSRRLPTTVSVACGKRRRDPVGDLAVARGSGRRRGTGASSASPGDRRGSPAPAARATPGPVSGSSRACTCSTVAPRISSWARVVVSDGGGRDDVAAHAVAVAGQCQGVGVDAAGAVDQGLARADRAPFQEVTDGGERRVDLHRLEPDQDETVGEPDEIGAFRASAMWGWITRSLLGRRNTGGRASGSRRTGPT